MHKIIPPPFPWFGGKRAVAGEVWKRFGSVTTYVEPFFGAGAVLLGAPERSKHEVINDRDCLVANFWRAAQRAPAELAEIASAPINEAEHTARHVYVCEHMDDLQPRIMADVSYYDVTVAGYWLYSIRRWIGGGYASGRGPWGVQVGADGCRRLVDSRKTPGVRGVITRQRPNDRERVQLYGEALPYIEALSERLQRVVVLCGDWLRTVAPAIFTRVPGSASAVFLDPPYSSDRRITYRVDGDLRGEIMSWCQENGSNEKMRIAICGYDGEYNELQSDGWTTYAWRANGGMANSNKKGNENRSKERIWFSPHCLQPKLTPEK